MPTPSESRALLFLAAVAALGLGTRACRASREPVPQSDREALAVQIARVDSAVTAGGRPKKQQLQPQSTQRNNGEALRRSPVPSVVDGVSGVTALIDVDVATAEELDALPGIGPALAARIVADRTANGAFGSLDGLQQVKGIGPAMAAKLAPRVTFSGLPRPVATSQSPSATQPQVPSRDRRP